jgi:hypothetical protein
MIASLYRRGQRGAAAMRLLDLLLDDELDAKRPLRLEALNAERARARLDDVVIT